MQQGFCQKLDGRALAAFGAGALTVLLLPRFLIGILGAAMVLTAGCLVTQMQHTEKGSADMKIVLMRSPGILAPLLRRIFGVRKGK